MAVFGKKHTNALLPGLCDTGTLGARAEVLFGEGYNCAEVLVRVFIEAGLIEGQDAATLELVSTGFGKGMGKTLGNCGALVGAMLVLNMVFGRRLAKRKWVYKVSGEFTELFHDRFRDLSCGQLRQRGAWDCKSLTRETAVMLGDFLAKRLPGLV